MSFKLSIVAPAGMVFEGSVDSLAVRGLEGAFEVYSRHTPLISILKAGHARVRQGDRVTAFDITSGVIEVDLEHNVTLLADQASTL
jgi:ATP synthase F1 epsilon subunit